MKKISTYSFIASILAGLLLLSFSNISTPIVDGQLGSITGKVTYEGTVPKLNPHKGCGDGPIANQTLVLGDGNTLSNVFIVVKNAPPVRRPTPTEPVVIEQNGCITSPRVAGVQAGQPLAFKNSDGILHNVHGLPKVNREFNIGMPPGAKESITLDKPEKPFPVKCDVHPWMNVYVAVMTHPYFAVSDANGNFKIENLPDGSYSVEAWHERLPFKSAAVVVRNGTANLSIAMSNPEKKK